MWFLLEELDSVSASVAVMLADELKVLSSQFFRCSSPSFLHVANYRWEYHIDPSTLRENDNGSVNVSNSFISILHFRFSFLLTHVLSPSQA